jgi:hypothetical protein
MKLTHQKITKFWSITVLILATSLLLPLQAQVVLFNNFAPGNAVVDTSGETSAWIYNGSDPSMSFGYASAEEFTVASGSNYTLSSVTLGLQILTLPDYAQDYSNYAVELLANNNGAPGAVLGTLADATPALNGEPTAITFTAPANLTLDGGQSYWVEVTPVTLDVNDDAHNLYVAWWDNQEGVQSVFASREINADGQISSWYNTSSTTEGGYMLVEADASATPEPSTWALVGFGAVLLLVWGRSGVRTPGRRGGVGLMRE